jgi:hypothetical protein
MGSKTVDILYSTRDCFGLLFLFFLLNHIYLETKHNDCSIPDRIPGITAFAGLSGLMDLFITNAELVANWNDQV